MDIRRIDDKVSVSPQVMPAEMAAVAAAGFRSVICNRPDGEGPGQPKASELKAAAEAAGLAFRYIPVAPGKATPADVAAFAESVNDMPGPVLAFCYSGGRSSSLYQAAQASGRVR